MKQFLLLRSNKQTGPYSAEELKQMGLKSYDLIWVEGKSAAWRYPGEIEDLKSFAPPVEEQPYDRFYKKPQVAAENQQSTVEAPPVVQTPPAAKPIEKPAPKKEKEYKRVFVTLPSNGNGAPSTPIEKPAAAAAPVVEKKPEFQPKAVAAQENAEEVYFPRKKTFRIKPVALAAIAIGMVSMIALGIWIGLSIDKKEQGVSLIKKSDPVPANYNKSDEGLIDQANKSNETLVAPDSVIYDQAALPQHKKSVRIPAPSNVNLSTDSGKYAAKDKPDTNDVAREDLRIKKPAPKPAMPDFEKLVSVSNNDYKVGPFGGISSSRLR